MPPILPTALVVDKISAGDKIPWSVMRAQEGASGKMREDKSESPDKKNPRRDESNREKSNMQFHNDCQPLLLLVFSFSCSSSTLGRANPYVLRFTQ